MKQTFSILAIASLISLTNAHGYISNPRARMPGTAMSAACGQQVYNNQAADRAGNVQGELQIASNQPDYDESACHIWLCKGYQYRDNTANVQSYTAGESVDFVIDIVAPHTGVANVSIVDTATNTVIGSPLKEWTGGYASTETGVTKDDTNFSVTIPDGLDGLCSEAGACVIQWYWFAESVDQTYESCVDFTIGGGSSGSGGSSSSANTATATATTETSAPTSSTASTTEITTITTATSVPTTLSTTTRPTGTVTQTATEPATPTGTGVPIPTDGTSDEQLNWISSIFKAVYSYE